LTNSTEPTSLHYPRLLRRVRAVLIDTVLIYIVAIFLWMMLLPLLDRFSPLFRIAYPVMAFLALEPMMVAFTGGSPGHHIISIAIHDSRTGSRIGVIRALIRFILRTLLGWLSLVLVLVTKKHQALHDIVCRTNVVLLDPDHLPDRERLSARVTEDPNFRYPSRFRRLIVIVVYLILSLLLFGVSSLVLLSDDCLLSDRCAPIDVLVVLLLNGLFILGVGSSVVFGWQARLFGCRRTRITT
jgi:uncharacterized RDD family membrane protein YckC